MKIAVYTAIFGDKDELREPLNFSDTESVDYFVITDNTAFKSANYKVILKDPVFNDITKNARFYKVNGLDFFKEYDYVIWHDANLQIIDNEIVNILKFVQTTGIAFFKHPERSCLYDEAIKCIKINKDYPLKILKQVTRYYFWGIKNNSGLYETSIVVKNNRLILKEFLDLWWTEIKNNSRRDQISLPYALSKYDLVPGLIDGDREKNPFAFFTPHKHHKYNFLSTKKPKKFNRTSKRIAIDIILFLKRKNN